MSVNEIVRDPSAIGEEMEMDDRVWPVNEKEAA
jgi:hypothetical protein